MPAWAAKIRLIGRRDLLSALAVACLFAAAGASCLYFLVHRVMIRSAQDRLMDLTQSTILRSDALVDTAIQQLNAMNQSRLPRCSPQDLDTLRDQIFKTGKLEDAGWFQGNQIRCSAQRPKSQGQTGDLRLIAILPNSLEVYRSDLLFSIQNKPTLLVRLGDAYVNTAELAREFNGPSWMQFSATLADVHGNSTGAHSQQTASLFLSPGKYLYRDRIYTTACSTRYRICDTVSVSVRYVLHRDVAPTVIALICGAVIGGMLGAFSPSRTAAVRPLKASFTGPSAEIISILNTSPSHASATSRLWAPKRSAVGESRAARWNNRSTLSGSPSRKTGSALSR